MTEKECQEDLLRWKIALKVQEEGYKQLKEERETLFQEWSIWRDESKRLYNKLEIIQKWYDDDFNQASDKGLKFKKILESK